MNFSLHQDAALEHEEQVAWYEARAAGLGKRYHDAFLEAMHRACERPGRFRITAASDVRSIELHGFPFGLIFRESNGELQVLAVAAHRRRPGYWLQRR